MTETGTTTASERGATDDGINVCSPPLGETPRENREEIEKALRESLRERRGRDDRFPRSEEQLRDFIENGTLGMHSIGSDGTILWANRAELELLGYTAEEYIGRPIADFHADQSAISDLIARLHRNESIHNYEARLRAKDGSIKHVLISSSVYWRDGEFIHTRCFTQDITERWSAEEALRQSERQLQLVTDALPALVAFVDAEQRYRFVSAAYERWFGHKKTEVLGKHLEEVLGHDAYKAVKPHAELALRGASISYEAELPYRDGGTRFIEATYIPQRAADGTTTGFVALVADVTEWKSFERFRTAAATRAEKLLKITAAIADAVSSDQVFEALVDHVAEAVDASSAALWLIDEGDGTARLVRARGYSEAAQQTFAAVPLGATPSIPAVDCIQSREAIWIGSQADMLERYPHLGSFATAESSYRISCLPLIAHGRVLGTLGLTIEEACDPSEDERDFLLLVARYASQAVERLRLFEAERHSRAEADAAAARLEETIRSNELFAGVLAHDLRNPLNAIMTAAQLVLMRREGESAGERDAKPLSRILSSGERMTTMIDQLLDFTSARSGGGIDVQPRETNLADLCTQAIGELELVHPEWKIHREIRGDHSGTWDPDRLLQVISNLVANAGQHGSPGANISVVLDGTDPDQVTFEVHNRGAVPASLLPLLFDPFRSTRYRRGLSRGLGLGLFIVREIVRAHGGTVDVSSSEPAGTTFAVKLPRRRSRSVPSETRLEMRGTM